MKRRSRRWWFWMPSFRMSCDWATFPFFADVEQKYRNVYREKLKSLPPTHDRDCRLLCVNRPLTRGQSEFTKKHPAFGKHIRRVAAKSRSLKAVYYYKAVEQEWRVVLRKFGYQVDRYHRQVQYQAWNYTTGRLYLPSASYTIIHQCQVNYIWVIWALLSWAVKTRHRLPMPEVFCRKWSYLTWLAFMPYLTYHQIKYMVCFMPARFREQLLRNWFSTQDKQKQSTTFLKLPWMPWRLNYNVSSRISETTAFLALECYFAIFLSNWHAANTGSMNIYKDQLEMKTLPWWILYCQSKLEICMTFGFASVWSFAVYPTISWRTVSGYITWTILPYLLGTLSMEF